MTDNFQDQLSAIYFSLGVPQRVFEGEQEATPSAHFVGQERLRLIDLRGWTENILLKPMFLHVFKDCLPREQYRFPKSKKKRICRKWAKDLRNYRPFIPEITWEQEL